MPKKNKNASPNSQWSKAGSCCQVESVVSVDERGQMLLPKEIREKAKIRPGDKLAVISWKKGDEVCCISLIKTGEFADKIKDILGPMMEDFKK